MEPIKYTLPILLLLFQLANSVPVAQWQTLSAQCSSSCAADPQLIRFDSGKTYLYRLVTKTSIFAFDGTPESVDLEAQVELTAHSNCEMSLQLKDVRFDGFAPNVNQLYANELQLEPIQFGYSDGLVTDVCPSVRDQSWAVDVKKSVISALQMNAKSLSTDSVVMEKDILGECQTIYSPQVRRYATPSVVTKTKQLNQCQNRQKSLFGLFPRSYGNAAINTIPLMNATYVCQQTIDNDLIFGTTCRETQQLRSTQLSFQSDLNLRFEKQLNGLSVKKVEEWRRETHHLLMSSRSDSNKWSEKRSFGSESDLIQLLRTICQQIESNSGQKEQIVESFPELVSALRYSSAVERVAKSVQNGEMCSSAQLSDLFFDASALAGSEAGAQVLVNAYESGVLSRERSSYLFTLMAFTSEVNENAVKKVLPLLRSNQTPKHVILGITGLIHNARHSRDVNRQTMKEYVSEAIQSLVQRLNENQKESENVAIIKALENIGLDDNSADNARQQLVSMATNQRQSQSVRIAAIRALTDSAIDYKQRQQLFELFARENESNEIRIQAYKAVVMSGADNQLLQKIREQVKRENNRDIQQYVRSHQKNLRETSDPHKKYVLSSSAPKFDEPSNQWFGISNNFETSFMLDAVAVGVALEADVINGKESEIPRSVSLNITVPAFGKELQLIEIQMRQKGFDSVIKQKMRQLKNSRKSGQSMASQMMYQMLDIVSNADQWVNTISGRDVQLEVNMKVDSKTILSMDLSDIRMDSRQLWNKLRQQLEQRVDIDRAFAIQPVNTRIQLPTTNGFPITLRLNATLVSGLKAKAKVSGSNPSGIEAMIWPSIAVQLETGIEFSAKSERKSLEMVTKLSSSPVFDGKAEFKDERIGNLKINSEKDKQNILKIENYVKNRNGRQSRNQYNDYKWCSTSTQKVFGHQLCAKFNSNPMVYELSVEKTDRTLKSFEFQIEMPPKSAREMKNYRIGFNTPNSEVDRQFSAELQYTTPNSGRQEAKLELRSPWLRWSAQGSVRNEEKEQSIQLEVQRDGKKQLSADAGIESVTRGQKREYRPRLRVQWGGQQEPITMQGTVSVSKGRKNQLQINLEGNQKQFLKGSFVREGERKSNDLRVSSEVSMNLPGIEIRINGLADKGSKHMTSDLTLEYRLNGKRKESLKLSTKVQNLTQSQLTKMSAFGELTSTQFPNANIHLAYNLLRKPNEHIENELTVAWKQQLKDKVHVLHVSKRTQQSNSEYKLENTLDVEITPINVNYELRANADIHNGAQGGGGPKYSVELVGKDRTGRKENDVRGSYQYQHLSRSPLHLTMEATIKTSAREMAYRDELREVGEGEYKGDTSVQWMKGQKAELQYNYKVKKGSAVHHEMEAELKSPHSLYPIRHSGVLRLTRHELELKSKLNSNGKQFYSFDTVLSKQSDSRLGLELANGLNAKLYANPYSVPQKASFELSNGLNEWSHKSNLEFVPKTSFAFKSDTKHNNQNVFALDSHISSSQPSRIVLNSEPFEGRLDCDLGTDSMSKRSANLELKSVSNDWKHSSSVGLEPMNQKLYSFESKTESKGKPILNVNSEFNRKLDGFLNVETQQSSLAFNANNLLNGRQKSATFDINLNNDLKHKTMFENNENFIKIQSKSHKNNQLFNQFNYNNNNNNLHSFNTKFGDNYQLELEGQQWNHNQLVAPYVRIGGKANQLTHNSKLTFNPNNVIIESNTKRSGENVLDLNGLLSRDLNSESSLKVQSPQIRSQFTSTPNTGAKFEWNSNQVNHVSSMEWPMKGQDNSRDWSLDSKTQMKNSNNYYNFKGKHLLKESLISTQNPIFESEIHFQRHQIQSPKLKINLQSRDAQALPWNHVSEWEADSRAQQYKLMSRTERANNRQNVLALNGVYNQLNSPSNLELKLGQQVEAKVRVQPFSQQKSVQIEAKSRNMNHMTDIELNGNSINLKSRTEDMNGNNLAKIDSYLTPFNGQKSHLSIVTQNSNANLNYEPKKSAKFELNSEPIQHKTEITSHQSGNGYKVVSKTTKSGQNLFDLNSALDLNGESSSHFDINSPKFQSKFSSNPSEKSGKIWFKNGFLEHNSDLDLNRKTFNSKTLLDQNLLHDFSAKFSTSNPNQINLEIPLFKSKTEFDLNQRTAQFDFKTKQNGRQYGRHLLASIRAKDGFHSDLAWDLDKDPNQRLIVDVNGRRVAGQGWASKGQLFFDVSANYAGNELKLSSQMTEKSVLIGPHEFELQYKPKYNPNRDSMNARFKHVITNGNQMECNFQYNEGMEMKFESKLNTKFDLNSDSHEISMNFETISPKNTDLEMKISFNTKYNYFRQKNSEIFAELKALKKSIGNQYIFRTNFKQNSNQFTGQLTAETPTIGQQNLNFELNLDSPQNQLTLNAVNQNGKQLEVTASAQSNAAQFDLKSNVDSIPSIRAHAQYIPQQEISFTLDSDANRKVDFSVKKSGNYLQSGIQLSGKLQTSYWPTLETQNRLKWNGNEMELESNVKYDLKSLFSCEINARKSSHVWSGNGQLSANGIQLAKASIDSNYGANSLSYILNANAKDLSAIHVTFNTELISGNERKVSLKLCSDSEKCIDLKSAVKYSARHNSIPEKVWISLTKMGTNLELKTSLMETIEQSSDSSHSLLGLSHDRPVMQRLRNQLLVSINAHSFGFDSYWTSRDRSNNAFDSSVKLFFPSNQIEFKTDFNRNSNREMIFKTQFNTNQMKPLFETTVKIEKPNENQLNAEFEINSEKFSRNPKKILIETKQQKNEFYSKLSLDLSNNANNALTIETQTQSKALSYSQYSNQTLVLNVSTRDKRLIDFNVNAHISPRSVGVTYSNVNRRGQKREAFLYVKTTNEKNFEGMLGNNENQYRIEGNYGKNNEELATDFTVFNEKNGNKRDFRLALDKQCLKFESKRDNNLDKKYNLCFNSINNSDKILALSLESIDQRNGAKNVDLNLELNGKDSMKIDLNWSPELFQKNGFNGYNNLFEWNRELMDELSHKWSTISEQFEDDVVMPVLSLLSDQFYDVIQEIVHNFRPLQRAFEWMQQYWQQISRASAQLRDSLSQMADYLIPDSVQYQWRSLTRSARKQCKRSEMCYKMIYSLENYGLESFLDLLYSNSLQALKSTHRLVLNTSGRFVASLPALPDWLQSYVDYYRQSIRQSIDTIIESNSDLSRLSSHVRTIGSELIKESTNEINWNSIQNSFQQIFKIVFSNYSSRVLVWDPTNGKIQMELRSPVVQSRRLRAILDDIKGTKSTFY